ncbi:hypothetical protein [Tenacibaculum mesophilum]|uniref:hypothetical protein n=1 Tax=Tenacibaculum mesophilum TaxID=104268 RepID=UPI000A7EB61C|nr:hypothetical protein [Tenacibaculum mesophilum]
MSFSGSVSSMITSFKNNKRKRTSAFEKLERFQKEKNNKLFFKKTANEKQLKNIRLKIKRQQQVNFIKNILALIATFLTLLYIISLV